VERWREQLAPDEVLLRLEQQQRAVAERLPQQIVGVTLVFGSPVSNLRITSRSIVTTLCGSPPIRALKLGP
jgi:hypothetical protein